MKTGFKKFLNYKLVLGIALILGGGNIYAQSLRLEPIKYGDFSNWVTREITESKVLGGKTKKVYLKDWSASSCSVSLLYTMPSLCFVMS